MNNAATKTDREILTAYTDADARWQDAIYVDSAAQDRAEFDMNAARKELDARGLTKLVWDRHGDPLTGIPAAKYRVAGGRAYRAPRPVRQTEWDRIQTANMRIARGW